MVDDSDVNNLMFENDELDLPKETTTDDETFPSFEDQRNIIIQLLKENQENAKEGDRVYIIPQFWYADFFNPQTVDPSQLGPIDTALICRDYGNFILAEYDRNPYISIPESVFVKLVSWYGLTNNSQPVSTHLVYDENRSLITEYNQCVFRVHHLVDNDQERRHGGGINRRVSYFAISRLCTVKQLSIKILDTFFERESDLDISQAKFKIWFVKDSERAGSNSILSSSFKLDPLQFMQLATHRRITPQLFDHTLKDVDILTGDFVVELRQSNKNYHWISNYFIYNRLTPTGGTTGLYNLGNTCYMNSALQCLVHIPELRDYFLYNCYEAEININNPLGYKGYVARAFSGLVQNLFGGKALASCSNLSSSYSPTGFKGTIGHVNSMFSGYMQQDSQEFITFLLDGLHEDLNRIVNKPYIEKPSLSPEDDSNDFNVIKRLAEDTWKLHLRRNDSVITDLFVGLYESTLQCPECNNVSITFDPYNDLTLPLPVNTVWHCKVKVFPQNSPPCILEVEMGKSSTYQDLKEYVAKYADLDPKNLYGCEIFSHQFYNNYESPESNSQFLPIQELISESDDVIFYEIIASKDDTVVPVLNSRIEEGFKSPRLFGVPFFIALSPDEKTNPGAIRYKIEKYFSHLSGGFVEFPSQSEEKDHLSSAFPLLREKYPECTLDEYQKFLNYAVQEDIGTIDKYFKIKVIEETAAEDDSNQQMLLDADDTSPRFWTPYSPININRAKDISELLNPVVRDIYDYPSLLKTTMHPITEDNGSNEQSDKVTNLLNESDRAQDSDVDLENVQEVQNKNVMSSEQYETPVQSNNKNNNNNNNNNINDNKVTPLVNFHTSIVCEWSEPAIQEVFSEDKLINWEKPAELKNTQLEVDRQKRQQEEEKKITLHDCLKLFSKREVLGMNDSWYCPKCREHRQATKQIQLWDTPDVLLIHLKRFENLRSFSDKIDEVVYFPITGLDMSPYMVNKEDPRGTIYDLVAVDNHYGGLGGGHYTAYAKNSSDSRWYYFDDSRVTETSPERSIASSAYLLFYMRRTADGKCGTQDLQELIRKSRENYDYGIKQMYDRQKLLFESNKTDSEELVEMDEQSSNMTAPRDGTSLDDRGDSPEANGSPSSHDNSVSARSADYSVRSLEVGRLQPTESLEENESNMGRRKLRILNKTYNEPSIAHSPTSSVSSDDGTDSISAVISQPKSGNDNILRSPTKD